MRVWCKPFTILFVGLLIVPLCLWPTSLYNPFSNPPTKGSQLNSQGLWSNISPVQYGILWSRIYGTSGKESSEAIIQCLDGGYAIAGNTVYQSCQVAYLIRTDGLGNILWEKTFSCYSEAKDIIQCLDGGFAIVGDSQFFNRPGPDLLVLRVDVQGELLWNQSFGGWVTDEGSAIVACQDGGFAVCGHTYNFGAGNSDLWLLRLDGNGNLRWNRTYGGEGWEEGRDLVECDGGGFAITGYTSSFSVDGWDVWLIRTDAEGNHLWNCTYGSSDTDIGQSLVECRNTGFAIAATINPTAHIYSWIIYVNTEGMHIWNRTYEESRTNHISDILESPEGGFAIVGTITEWNPSGEHSDILFFYLGVNGEILWSLNIGGSTDEGGRSIAACQEGGFIITGTLHTTGYEQSYILVTRIALLPSNVTLLLALLLSIIGISATVILITFYLHRRFIRTSRNQENE